MTEFIQHLINGLSVGSMYALIAIGYTLVFGVLQLINFAHGEIFMLGAFVGMYSALFFGFGQTSSLLGLFLVLTLSMLVCAGVGYVIERFAYRPLRKAPRINVLITAVGVSMFLQFTGQLFFGSDPKFFPQIYSPAGYWSVGSVQLNPLQFFVLGISLCLMMALHRLVFHTRMGRAMRAVSFNHDLASLMGIPTNRVISYTFMVGSALAGAAGVLVGLTYPKIEPLMGVMPGLKAFVAVVLGGVGSILGAVVGSLILGLAEEFVVGYWAPTYRDALSFGILILILLIKPRGLFGKIQIEKV
ncbi:MAG: branched-chain amino acid ABC transporter permease [Deltaproteobacteria bacterium]|nr:branched-chain amino acid ABC transporter permease [Deltaproteobacteria bacterium]